MRSTIRKIWKVLTLRCPEAHRLASDQLEQKLPTHERVALQMHRFVCGTCRHMRKQFSVLRLGSQAIHEEELRQLDDGPNLNAHCKARIKENIRSL